MKRKTVEERRRVSRVSNYAKYRLKLVVCHVIYDVREVISIHFFVD